MASVVTALTVPPPAWSGAGRERAPSPDERTGAVRARTSCGPRGRRSRGGRDRRGGACRSRRCGASWAASTRIRPPAAWTFSANSCTGCTTPVTFDAPDTASSATRPACSARRRSRSSTSSVPSGRRPTWTVRKRASPRQVVRVVFEHRRQHHRSSSTANDRASRLIASVVFLANTTTSRSGSAPRNPPTSSRARSNAVVLTSRLVAGPPMDPRVERQELLDRLDHRPERRCARRVVQVHVRHEPAIEQRDQLIDADERVARHRDARVRRRRARPVRSSPAPLSGRSAAHRSPATGFRRRRWRASVADRSTT